MGPLVRKAFESHGTARHNFSSAAWSGQDSPLFPGCERDGVGRNARARIAACGAIVFLLVGSVSVIIGYKARIGAVLLLTFLVLASYWFHAFWNLQGQAQQEQMIQFMKNLSIMGAMLFIAGNGAGPMSVDSWLHNRALVHAEVPETIAHATAA